MTGTNSAILLVGVLDLIGTFVFAISGAALGVQRGMDLFGVLVLAFVTAVVGGARHAVEGRPSPLLRRTSWSGLAVGRDAPHAALQHRSLSVLDEATGSFQPR